MLVTVGVGMYMDWSAALVVEVPPGVGTITSTMPFPVGLTTVICVSLTMVKFVTAAAPNETLVAQLNPLPVMVTLVPPPAGPLIGLMLDTDGGVG